jgi:general secretion pathway protein J
MRNNNQGFTLLEVLIALFIFTIVSIIMVSGLRTVLNSQAVTTIQADKLANLQLTLLLLSRDIEQAINRPVTNAKGNIDPGLIGTPTSLAFTHAGMVNPKGQLQRSTLQRTQYVFEKNNLIRNTWQVLDQSAKTLPSVRIMLDNLTNLRFEYLNPQGKFTNNLPEGGISQTALPSGIRVHLTIKNWGTITQFYLLPTSGQESAKKTT